MILRMIPEDYRALMEYISPAAFKVINYKKAMIQLLKISKNSINQKQVREVTAAHQDLMGDHLRISKLATSEELEDVDQLKLAEQILDIYFSQFFSLSGCFLDLRLKHFKASKTILHWNPSSFVHRFDAEFSDGMLLIYEGYYFENHNKLTEGMVKVGLITDTNPAAVEEIKKLLFSHFGEASDKEVIFELDHFKASFHSLFLYLKKNKIQLSSDFLFLGIYLVTLYLTLAKIGQPVDVNFCFRRSLERNRKIP